MSDLDEAARADPGADGDAERRPPPVGTLRSELHLRLDAITTELAALRRLIEQLPQMVRKAVWQRLD